MRELARNAVVSVVAALSLGGLAACAAGWEKITPPGSTLSFELPRPVAKSQREGMLTFEAKSGKTEFWVAVVPRDYQAETAEGASDETSLARFANGNLDGLQQNLVKAGYQPEVQEDGSSDFPGGAVKRYMVKIAGHSIINQFYITRANYIYVKIDDPQESEKAVHQFFDSFMTTEG